MSRWKPVVAAPAELDPRREALLEAAVAAADSVLPRAGGLKIEPRDGWEHCPKNWKHTPEADRFAERRLIRAGASRCKKCGQRSLRWVASTRKPGKFYLVQRWELEWYDERGGWANTVEEPHFLTCTAQQKTEETKS